MNVTQIQNEVRRSYGSLVLAARRTNPWLPLANAEARARTELQQCIAAAHDFSSEAYAWAMATLDLCSFDPMAHYLLCRDAVQTIGAQLMCQGALEVLILDENAAAHYLE